MENDLGVEDLPDDLTPFITRTTLDHISGGAFGDVWKCNYNAGGVSALVAVKAFRFSDGDDLETINRQISREIGILKILRHNNIVRLCGIATGFGRMLQLRCLVSPWMPNGTLNTYLQSNHSDLTALDRSRMLEDVSAGLRYLHSKSVIHGDITGANILIDKRGHARLIDFGLSTIVRPLVGQSHLARSSVHPGAIRYAAPELVLSDNAQEMPLEKADVYSFGCIMLQVLSGWLPWSETSSGQLLACIVVAMSQRRGPQRPDGHPTIINLDWDFIQKCLQFGPELRPSADEVLEFVMHRFSSSDSSRPPDDPPDDAQDGFPGASPRDDSGGPSTTQQPPNSLPPDLDYELKNLTTFLEGLSTSGNLNESSTTPDHGSHSLGEMFLCMWGGPHGLLCNQLIRGYDLPSHLREFHGIRGSDKLHTRCRWNSCDMDMKKESLARHVKETHMGIVHPCSCGKKFSRRDTLNRHKKSCSG